MAYKNNYKKEESDLLKENMTPQHIVINNPGQVIIQAPSSPSNIPPYEDETDSKLQTSIQPPVPDDQIPPYEDEEQSPEQIQNNQIQPPMHNMGNVPPYEDENEEGQIPVDPETGQPMQMQNPGGQPDSNQVPPYEDEEQTDVFMGQPPNPNESNDINQPMDYGYNYNYNTGEDVPSYEDEEQEPQQNDGGIPIDPETGQPMQAGPGNASEQVPPYEDEEQPQMDPATGQPVQPQMDPATGQPVQQGNEIPPYEDEMGQGIDPATGQPVQPQMDPSTGQPQGPPFAADPNNPVDPNTGMPTGTPQLDPQTSNPIDPATGQPVDPSGGTQSADPFAPPPYTSSYTDEKNPHLRVGNSSEVTTGRPIPVEDLEKLKELKKINAQLMKIKNILEKELDKSYNKVEDKLNEAIEYFRTIISNLDSYVDQVPDIIIKYKRFILTLLTQINILKQQELEEKGIRKKDKSDDKKSKKDDEKDNKNKKSSKE